MKIIYIRDYTILVFYQISIQYFDSQSTRLGRQAFGNITFAGITQHVAKYALLHHDTNMREIYSNLMLNHWQVPKPNLLISVTGSAHMIKGINGALLDAFRRGLYESAAHTGAWIVSGQFFHHITNY